MANWLSGWAKRIEITISNTNVDSTLTNFPVLLYLSASSGTGSDDVSCIFDELTQDANRKKIAVTTSDGETQCYVEIERWDDTNEKAWLWVKVPSVSNSAETVLYLYYDSSQSDNTTYVGDTGDSPAQSVWDSNFTLVWHMGQDPSGGSECILDSTSNGNNGTPAGAMTSGDLVDGQIGKCIEFDGSDDEINMKTMISDSTMTMEILYYCTDYGTWTMFCGKDGSTTDFFGFYPASTIRVRADNTDADVSEALATNAWINLAASLDGSNATIMEDGVSKGTPALSAKVFDIDTLGYGFTTTDYHLTGKVCEFRLSDIARGADWLKATHYSNNDGICGYGSEETEPTITTVTCPNPFQVGLDLSALMDIEVACLSAFDCGISLSATPGFLVQAPEAFQLPISFSIASINYIAMELIRHASTITKIYAKDSDITKLLSENSIITKILSEESSMD